MNVLIKKGILLLLAGILIFSLSACIVQNGKNQNQSEQKEMSEAQRSKLKMPEVRLLGLEADVDDFQEPLERRFGGTIKATIMPLGQIEQKLMAAVLSGDSYDVVRMNTNFMPKVAMKGLLQPIGRYMNVNDTIFSEMISFMDQFKYKGEYYVVPGSTPASFFIIFNQTHFDNNGMKTPKEYAQEKKWTWDTFQEVAIRMTQRSDDVVEVWGAIGANFHIPVMLSYGGKEIVEITSDGVILETLSSPEVIQAFQFYQDAVYKYKYFPDRTKTNRVEDQFVEGKVAMLIGRAYMIKNTIRDNIKYEWDIAPLPVPAYTDRQTIHAMTGLFGIPEGAPNPEGGAAFINLVMTEVGQIRNERDLEGLSPEHENLVNEINRYARVPLFMGVGAVRNLVNTQILNELDRGMPVVSTIEKYKPLIQAEIDNFLKD